MVGFWCIIVIWRTENGSGGVREGRRVESSVEFPYVMGSELPLSLFAWFLLLFVLLELYIY